MALINEYRLVARHGRGFRNRLDELTVTGLDGEDPKKLLDRLYDLVHRTVVPSPDVTVEDHQVDGKTILVLHVAPRPAPRYGSPRTKAPGTSPSSTCAGASSTYPAQPASPIICSIEDLAYE